jgi:hypothetical protein
MLFEAGGDGTEVLEFAEEAFDEVAAAIELPPAVYECVT